MSWLWKAQEDEMEGKLEKLKASGRKQDGMIEELQELIRDKNQLIANQNAEITALRKMIVGISEVLEDLIEGSAGYTEALRKLKSAIDGK